MTPKQDNQISQKSKVESTNQAWGGRFKEATDAFVQRFTASVEFDIQMADQDIQGSIAHAKMLNKIGVLTEQELSDIQKGLLEVKAEIDAGTFEWQIELEDVHMNIEAALTDKIGIAGKKLHTGRSRNDQVATDIRLYLREETKTLIEGVKAVQKSVVGLAKQHADTIMPGFTHLQTAQPVTFGHHMLAWYEMLYRDEQRLEDCLKRINHMPLGAAALAGTTYPIDRTMTADLLAFDHICQNSLDAVSDRDFLIEFASAISIMMMHLSRFSEELVLWTSAQFDFIELPDRYCTGSSIMPQKKNPDVPELIRGKTGRVYGHLMSLLTLMKSQCLTYNKDNQEDKEPIFDLIVTAKHCLMSYADMMPHVVCKKENMYHAALKGFATATDLADYLVKKGMPFRQSHEVVGSCVAYAVEHDITLDQINLQQYQTYSELIDDDVYQCLTLEGSVAARDHLGGTSPKQVLTQVKAVEQRFVD